MIMIPTDLNKEYKQGTYVYLDGVTLVKVKAQTPIRLYTMVSDGFGTWKVMTYRLTETQTGL